ncbi:MAG: spermidine synthase [Patescibacteria group bacterium]
MNKTFANFFVFTTGAVIMAIELTASRLLAPYFGSSIFVWGNVIGVVMITMAIGYWWGGRLADKKPRIKTLAVLILSCGLFLSALPIFFRPLVTLIIGLLNYSSLVAFALICFWVLLVILAFPMVILAMTSPFIIRLLNKQLDTTGRVAGGVFAAGTVGSIFGVFMATFITVPFLGSLETILICSAALIMLAGLSFRSKYKMLALLVFLPMMVYLGVGSRPISNLDGLIYEKETPYQYLRVVDAGGWRFLQFNEGAAVQSYINFNSPHFLTGGSYYDYFNLLPRLSGKENDEKTFLIIGGGGGVAAKQLVSYWRPDISIDLVEIDREVIDVAQRFFNMTENQIHVYNQDGRQFLNQIDKQYDYIIVDAYSNQLFIPFQLTTDEFFQLAESKLRAGGVLAINVNADGFDSDLLQRIAQTIKKNFAQVAVLSLENCYNHLVFASNRPMRFDFNDDALDADLKQLAEKFNDVKIIQDSKKEMILTDNRAPIEYMTDKMVLKLFLEYVMN